ncbi:glyoxalase family protein [Roseobacter sp. SK209-2-6]|nr:glyoxalase family protein [Roseobacter sp. SK209-2-6]
MPALSLYCKDPDGHSVEFLAKLDQRPDPDLGQGSYSQWQKR